MAQFQSFKTKLCHINTHIGNEAVEETKVFQGTNRRLVPSAVSTYVLNNNLLKQSVCKKQSGDKKIWNICEPCMDHILKLIPNPPKRQKSEEEAGTSHSAVLSLSEQKEYDELCAAVEKLCTSLDQDKLSRAQTEMLCAAIGKRIRRDLSSISRGTKENRLDEIYAGSYQFVWKGYSDGILKNILEAVAGTTELSNRTCRNLSKCTEILQSTVDPKFISNTSLGEALVLMNFSRSRHAVDLLNKIVPSGSYSTLRRTIETIGSEQKHLPENDVVIVFDNSQVIGKSWNIKFQGKQPVSTVTSLIYCDLGHQSRNQFTLELPTALFPDARNSAELTSRYESFCEKSLDLHRDYRQKHIQFCLNKLVKDCELINGTVHDSISRNDYLEYRDIFQYSRVPNVARHTPVVDLDCIEVNPNSYVAVSKVLDTILEYIDSSNRKYITVVMDGLPYGICKKLVAETYICGLCNSTVASSELKNHEKLHNTPEINWQRKYKRIQIRPGNGHVELNAVRVILSLFWEPFLKPVAKMMNFKTPNGLEFFRKGLNFHMAYNTLMAMYCAYSLELLYPYVKECLLKKTKPSYEGFCRWESAVSSKNLTFRMSMDFCFTTLHSLQLFRSGIRTCNDFVSFCARHQVSSLFYATSSFKYQEFMANDTLYMLSLPKSTQPLVQMESSRRKPESAAEGFDFLLENRNKVYKSFLPMDKVPTFDNWLLISRTACQLENLREKAAERLDLKIDSTNADQNRKIDVEINEIRKLVRSLNVFVNEKMPFVRVDEDKCPLDDTWIDYVRLSTNNQNLYARSYINNCIPKLPTFNIGEKEINLDNLSEAQLETSISQKIQGLAEPFNTFYKKALKGKKSKDDLKEFYKAVGNQIQNQLELESYHEDDLLYDFDYEDDNDE